MNLSPPMKIGLAAGLIALAVGLFFLLNPRKPAYTPPEALPTPVSVACEKCSKSWQSTWRDVQFKLLPSPHEGDFRVKCPTCGGDARVRDAKAAATESPTSFP